MTYVLVAVLAVALGWTICYRTRAAATRVERAIRPPGPHPIGLEDGVIRVALAAACCERWWTSAGAEHEDTCEQHRSTA